MSGTSEPAMTSIRAPYTNSCSSIGADYSKSKLFTHKYVVPMTRKYLILLFLSLIAFSLTGCGLLQKIGILPSPPESVVPALEVPLSQQTMITTLEITAEVNINLDTNSRPSPVKVRVFLTEPGIDLKSHTIEDIFELSGTELSATPRATTVIRPGASTSMTLTGVKSETQLSIAVAYREPYKTQWIVTHQMKSNDSVQISARITEFEVSFNNEI
ncbi:MAG: type VI secretion system lipoprotein TssJ [Granulosicoccus sp.]